MMQQKLPREITDELVAMRLQARRSGDFTALSARLTQLWQDRWTQTAIAEAMGVSRERARQLIRAGGGL